MDNNVEIIVQNQFIAMLFDIRNKPGTEKRVKDIHRAQHIINTWNTKAAEGDSESLERLEELSGLIKSRVKSLNEIILQVNDKYSDCENDLPIIKQDKFSEYTCVLKFDNPQNRALMAMLGAMDLTSTRMNIMFWNYKYDPKSEYFKLQKDLANPLRSVLQWVYKQASTH